MNNIIDFPLPEAVANPAPEAVPQPAAPKPPPPVVHAGHFLSMIAFDGMITLNTAEAIMMAQQEELKRTGGRAGLWVGWKHHAGEGQVRSRNECAWQFLRTPAKWHDLLDTDLIPTPEHIRRLRRHPEAADSIICGVYFKKQQKIAAVFNSLAAYEGNPTGNAPINKLGLMEISKGGTGFMQIPRSAYERVMEKFPERFYLCDYAKNPDGSRQKRFSFFFHDIRKDSEVGFMRDQSEDWAFCEMARAAGVKIYLDTTTSGENNDIPPVWHRGSALYPLPAEMERLQLEASCAELGKQLEAAHTEIAELKKQVSGR